MSHERECIAADGDWLCICDRLRAVYRRGREDSATAIFAATSYRPLIEWQSKLTAIALGGNP